MMETQTVHWETPLSRPLLLNLNASFLHSQKLRENLSESRKAFLKSINNEEVETPPEPIRKTPVKKISFKIKKTASVYRRNQQKTMNSNPKVAELTKKFNMINEKNVKMQVVRKPSVKTKLTDDKEIVIVRRKPVNKSAKSADEKTSVRATIEIFEQRTSIVANVPKPKVPEKPKFVEGKTEAVQTLEKNKPKPSLILETPQPKPVSPLENVKPKITFETPKPLQALENQKLKPPQNLETLKPPIENFKPKLIVDTPKPKATSPRALERETQNLETPKPPQTLENLKPKPNTSFLWKMNQDKSPSKDDWRDLYDFVDPTPQTYQKPQPEEKIYEELNCTLEDTVSHSYECCDDGYEICNKENIYETLPPPLLPRRQQQEPLPPRPPSRSSYCTIQNGENVSNCYESIYNPDSKSTELESTYESIYGCQIRSSGSNRDSLVSSDQQSNSLYGRASLVNWGDDNINPYKAHSDLSDRSDEWVDMSDNEDNETNSSEIIIIRERQKPKTAWSQQWSKASRKHPSNAHQSSDSDPDHLYESLATKTQPEEDYDSFDSDSDSGSSFTKVNSTDSGLDIGNNQLPEPPNNQAYVFTRLAATVKRKLRRNWSLTKNDISKSLSRMTKRKSRTDLSKDRKSSPEILPNDCDCPEPEAKTLPRKSFLTKFRRSMSLSAESASELTSSLENKPKSTFYLTDEIEVDKNESERDSGASLSPVQKSKVIMRPQSPPPPAPIPRKNKRSTSWYAEVGLFKNSESSPRRPNTFWYAEVGLYQTNRSTPSTSSAENSGNNKNDFINEEYYNLKNGTEYYNDSINSLSSTETKKDSFTNLTTDNHLRLEDEPLYQFYDAAVLESVCHEGTSDFDSDGYEEVGDNNSESRLSSRPSAMELVSPSKNSLAVSRTLWCEIPEVINSAVLSTLSSHQKKLQEAKFEMMTSEASYLNSLNVLHNHFIKNFDNSELVSKDEFDVLFGKVAAVKNCSEKLLYDMEKCWQDNILLHGVCDIVQKHAEENFHVYVSYCENQILLDETLRRLKEKTAFLELLRQMEANSTCQSLTLYSFLMLPMQRITRWPLLVDAVLKRLSPQDSEYLTCQYSLATMNKIVNQCNEGARRKERENEMKKIVTQLEFSKGVPPIEIIAENRWLIRSGTVTHMQQRTDEIKLTFGKRFSKVNLYLILFNDLLLVTKPKSENLYTVIHYCPRNLVDLSSTDSLLSVPMKETQGRHLVFLTILENQNEKTVEFLLSCSSESDKERWIEALTPPKSEDPDETLYECWDCPQVTAVHNYLASQPDELALAKGDVINVLRKMADGWYHGERIRDGQTGWFPANYTAEIANPHVRSRNLKQRYRLLAFSENYLKAK